MAPGVCAIGCAALNVAMHRTYDERSLAIGRAAPVPAPCRVTRRALYGRNCFGNHENIRTEVVMVAEAMGQAGKHKGFAEQCMEEYKLDGWTVPDLLDPDDIGIVIVMKK